MGIGTGIAIFVIGAILVFAVNVDTGGIVDLDLIGYILMGAGVVVFLISLVLVMRSRRTETVARTSVDPASGEQVTRRSIRNNDPIA
ncbi:DUF6458 family protein [Microbacterium sp. W4I20]|uniref:DUF6458 family protein n=1 Tax=Microbacterium sp. W4I20 TaxID=3042262 RepID=UPI002783C748|nr:DUF6458 family protein [Microbacterium sp. W4I20]MDQ0727650.1 hypothetical protein [Microbacterium sp. W4I20]